MWQRARDLFHTHRRRLATLVLFLGLAFIGVQMSHAVPRETRVSVPLGDSHADVTEVRIAYSSDGALAHEVTRRWPSGAPRDVRHDLELMPGDYDVSVRLGMRDGSVRRLSGRVTAPSDGVVRLALDGDR